MAGQSKEGAGEGTPHLRGTTVGKRVLESGKFSERSIEGELVFVEVAGGEGVGGVGSWVLQLGEGGW